MQSESLDLEVKSSVDKNKIALNETFNYKIDISGDVKTTPEIKLPDFKKNFYVLSSAQSQKISLKSKQSHLIITYEFILRAKETGKFKIEEAQVKFKGKLYKTKSVDIEIIPAEKPEVLPGDPKEETQPSSEGIFI